MPKIGSSVRCASASSNAAGGNLASPKEGYVVVNDARPGSDICVRQAANLPREFLGDEDSEERTTMTITGRLYIHRCPEHSHRTSMMEGDD